MNMPELLGYAFQCVNFLIYTPKDYRRDTKSETLHTKNLEFKNAT